MKSKTSLSVIEIAAACHEANRKLCEAFGDYSQPEWYDAPEWQFNSACQGVLHALENPEVTPEGSHENWMREKQRDGWKYGPTKDAEAKTHPCMLPYDALPEEQRVKDAMFLAIVRSLAPLVD